MFKSNQLILGLSTSKHWIEKVGKKLNLEVYILPKKTFSDQEILIEIPVSIRNRDVFVCQSTSTPANDTFMELIIAIDALKRASVKSISVIMPYYGYARQDRKAQGREPITAKLIANILTFLGITRVITFDLHSPQIQGFFDIPIDHLSALPQLISNLLKKEKIQNYVLVSPDHGGYQRVKKISEYLNSHVAIINKSRPTKNQTKVNFLLGNVKDKNLIFIDDIIDTGNTLINSLKFLKQKGAQDMFVVATHPVLSQNVLEKLNTLYQKGWLKKVLVSNSIWIEKQEQYPFLEVYCLSDDISAILTSIIQGKSISRYAQEQYEVLAQYKTNE